MRKTFGNDLEALLTLSDLNCPVSEGSGQEVASLDIANIAPGRYQPRKIFDQKSLDELGESIAAHGIIQPLIVREVACGKYEIIAGERRWRAAKFAGLSQVPVVIRDIDDKTAMAFGVIENIQRKDLNPIEESQSIKRLLVEFKLTQEEVAKSLGRPRATITNMLRLLDLSDPVKTMLEIGKIQVGHAKVLLPLPHDLQYQAAALVESKQLSVRATETLVKRICLSKNSKLVDNKSDLYFVNELKRNLEKRLPGDISIQMRKGGGMQVILKIDDPNEIKRAISVLLELPCVVSKEEAV